MIMVLAIDGMKWRIFWIPWMRAIELLRWGRINIGPGLTGLDLLILNTQLIENLILNKQCELFLTLYLTKSEKLQHRFDLMHYFERQPSIGHLASPFFVDRESPTGSPPMTVLGRTEKIGNDGALLNSAIFPCSTISTTTDLR